MDLEGKTLAKIREIIHELKLSELRPLAKDLGVVNYSKMSRDQLLQALSNDQQLWRARNPDQVQQIHQAYNSQKKTVGVRLDIVDYERLKDLATAQGKTAAEIAREFILEKLEDLT